MTSKPPRVIITDISPVIGLAVYLMERGYTIDEADRAMRPFVRARGDGLKEFDPAFLATMREIIERIDDTDAARRDASGGETTT